MEVIINKQTFNHIFNNSRTFSYGGIKFLYSIGNQPDIGFIVSKKRGIAVERNKFKRRCRYLFRETDIFQKHNLNLIVQPTKNLGGWDDLKVAFETLSSKIYD